jgi:hypothetical protein
MYNYVSVKNKNKLSALIFKIKKNFISSHPQERCECIEKKRDYQVME